VFLGYYQDMRWRSGIDVVKGVNIIIFIHLV
jgi:hypothetical protein